jgi:TatD DNase family protein
MIFETHAHYDDEKFKEDREQLIASLPEKGIKKVINVGADFAGCVDSVALAEKYDYVYAAIGIHPSNIEDATEENLDWIKEKTSWEKTVAIGEIGLDYYWDKEPTVQQAQREMFRRQLVIAGEADLPVIIHSRDAAEDTMDIMQQAHKDGISGVIHCYSYSREMAKEYVKMGYYIGVGGVVTFKNAKKLKETVAEIGLPHIVLETDCPYMAPEPHRGTRNDSTNLIYVVNTIAELTGTTPEEVQSVTWGNARKLFGKVK